MFSNPKKPATPSETFVGQAGTEKKIATVFDEVTRAVALLLIVISTSSIFMALLTGGWIISDDFLMFDSIFQGE